MGGQRAKKITSDQKQEIKLVKEKWSHKLKLQRNMIFLCHITLCPFIIDKERCHWYFFSYHYDHNII